MKNVFSNAQCAHVWAQQTQKSGRSSGDSMYFEGDSIYSYGAHYLMAKLFRVKGQRIAVINSNGYSMTTAKHTAHVRDALRGLDVLVMTLPDPSAIKSAANVKYLKDGVELRYAHCEANVRVDSKNDIRDRLANITTEIKRVNMYLKVMGLKPIKLNEKRYAAIKKHLEARFKRYLELQTPEMIAKRENDKVKRAEAKVRKSETEVRDSIVAFRQNGIIRGVLATLPYALLRIQGSEVMTSRGARVPLDAAREAVKRLLTPQVFEPFAIGQFQVEDVIFNNELNDTVIQAGCHRILLSEAKAVLGAL